MSFDIRYTEMEDLPFLEKWFEDPKELEPFPFDEHLKKDALKNWIGFSRFQASLTGTVDGVPCAVGTLFLMPYRKVAHHCSFYLIVDPKHRRKGFGYSMVKNLLHLAKMRFRLESVHVEVFEPNPLLSILKRLQFHSFARQEGFVELQGKMHARVLLEHFFVPQVSFRKEEKKKEEVSLLKGKRSEVEIRFAIQEDEASLVSWLQEEEASRWFPLANQKEAEDAARIWVSYAKQKGVLSAEVEGKLCGIANLYIQPCKKLAHQCLMAIIVADSYRGQGVGTKLLERLIELAKESFRIRLLHLEVYEGNPAIHLYKRFGFEQYGTQRHFVKEKTGYRAKILMQKTL